MADERKWYTGMFSTEDWWAFWIGLFFVILGLIAAVTKIDLTGWIVAFGNWVDITKSFHAAHKDLMSPVASLIVSYVIFSIVTAIGAWAMKWNVKDYLKAWTLIFIITTIAYIIGQYGYLSATSNKWSKLGISWSLQIGGAYYIIALIIGLLIGNFAPKGFKEFMKRAARPEWFIKIAIVALGAKLGLKAIEATGFAMHLLFAGVCATIAAYLLFWPLAYTMSRKVFKLSKEWSACLASGISICGVSAAIATAGAIRARPIVPVMISSLIVVFAVIELVILPGVLVTTWFHEPIAAGASLGLTVKTDGADAAAGAILDQLMISKAASMGIYWDEGWILASAIMTKIWIDMFIGVWAFVLATVWVYYFERKPGEKVQKMEIWWRFPKFVIGYFVAMFSVMGLGLAGILSHESLEFGLKPVEGALRHFFFMLTFTSIGIVTDFRALKEEGLGRLAIAYAVILAVIIIPIGWFIAWLFHHGMVPPSPQ
ncbi:putative membrane protein [Archaeoglobus sulfaticallidus PM70-1]|uniref:Putative membrane protein n=1 Tax=Archaeoglobus sulfaticallidus PM70-1 TaxID=387631 RepID=N0BKK8_9EURY|nr:putative sulfate exporter family transporter [Archaeoglobus sulfaticallidus]AGK61031.1 putative membrane protein [Archaeoglobus sulfaticallidus PM70-1]